MVAESPLHKYTDSDGMDRKKTVKLVLITTFCKQRTKGFTVRQTAARTRRHKDPSASYSYWDIKYHSSNQWFNIRPVTLFCTGREIKKEG